MNNIQEQVQEQIVEYIELVEQPQTPIINLAPWLKEGNSPAEIILAMAVLIKALTQLTKVVLPLLRKNSEGKSC